MSITRIKSYGISDGAITTNKISGDVSLGVKIASVQIANSSYSILDDTAVALEGGYLVITGSGFASGCQVIVGANTATSTTFVNSTTIRAQVGAADAGTKTLYVVNTDGGTAIRVNGLTYSATPTWVTGSTLSSYIVNQPVSIQLNASGATSYQLQAGSTLPTGLTLTANGLLSGAVTGIEEETTYSFIIEAIDDENQESFRTFSITIGFATPYRLDNFASNLRLALPFDQTYQFSDIAYKISGSPNTTSISQLNGSKTPTISTNRTKWSSFGYTSSYFLGTKSTPACKYTLPVTLDPRSSFTIEGWFWPTGVSNNWAISSGDVGGRFLFGIVSGTKNISLGTTQSIITLPSGFWYHIAITNTQVYVNGTLEGSTTYTCTGFTVLHVGQFTDTDNNQYLGNIQDLRVYIGARKYTSNFTPGDNSILQDYNYITPI
jgi:hypothetical protein